ncbi:MAG: hypothetical protein ABW022_13320 [Actinoplanes sp.]
MSTNLTRQMPAKGVPVTVTALPGIGGGVLFALRDDLDADTVDAVLGEAFATITAARISTRSRSGPSPGEWLCGFGAPRAGDKWAGGGR